MTTPTTPNTSATPAPTPTPAPASPAEKSIVDKWAEHWENRGV
jgi:hypothetical protein